MQLYIFLCSKPDAEKNPAFLVSHSCQLDRGWFYDKIYVWWCMFERVRAGGENYSPFEGGAKARESK